MIEYELETDGFSLAAWDHANARNENLPNIARTCTYWTGKFFLLILVTMLILPPSYALAFYAKPWCLLPEQYEAVELSGEYPDEVRFESTKTGNSCFCTPHGGDIIIPKPYVGDELLKLAQKGEVGLYLLGCINPDTGEFEVIYGGSIFVPSDKIPD